jgi:hypothetical protein
MKKLNVIGIECITLLILILIPFANCYDFDGDGVDDGEQNLCGDNFCQDWEDKINCPDDCSEESLAIYGFDSNQFKENSFFSSLAFKIITIVIGIILILLGIITYLKYHRKKISTTQIT